MAVHEAGHSLGLEHSNLKDAVMYPWYKGPLATDFDLRPDDINGVQALYGQLHVYSHPPCQQAIFSST